MFKFKQLQIVVVVAVVVMCLAWGAHARPGDIQGAAETVDVPPEHRAAPPQPAQPQPPVQFPVQPSYTPGAVFPPPAGGVGPLFPPLFFQTQSAFVPYASTFNAYRVNHATAAVAALQPKDLQAASLVVA